jgi:hypothetical protein
MKSVSRRLFACSSLLALALFTSCTIDSADEFSRDVSVNFSGFYTGNSGGKIVSNNSGNSITSLDLRQTGDSLEAVDNNGRIWRGNLGEVQNGTSSFELNGQTTAGRDGTFSGTLSSSGGSSSGTVNNAQGTMQGTYIESDRFGTFSATATIPGSVDNGGDDDSDLTISPTSATVAINATRAFSVSGSRGTITWTISGTGSGSVSPQTGTSTTFTRTTAGAITLTASDSAGGSVSATIN